MKTVVFLVAVVASTFALPKNVFEFQQGKPEPKDKDRQHWAVLVAGSNGYFNYRHQADVCHAYQILKRNGFNEDNIITMMYDDIALNRENPVKGNIINRPEGKNVYDGVKIDYKGEDVNPEKFLAILRGDEEKAGGKVLKSGPNDYVFINFVDHGGPGILGFGMKRSHLSPANGRMISSAPKWGEQLVAWMKCCGCSGMRNYRKPWLKASDLNDAIMYMNEQQKYAKMVFYVEACESGSIFLDLLPKDINVFATTAANAHESSYACYFDKTRRTYLGDVYSIKWMQNSDVEDLSSETLEKQFLITKEETNTSHVQQFGDMSISELPVADFLSTSFAPALAPEANIADACADAVKSEDVPLEILRRSLDLEETAEGRVAVQAQLDQLLKEREAVDLTMKIMVSMATENHIESTKMMEHRSHITKWECYEDAVDFLIENCPDHLKLPQNDYALRKLYMVVNMCENNIPLDYIKSSALKACSIEL